MATGYEGYVALEFSNPTAALPMAQSHLIALRQMISAKVSDAGSAYDSTALEAEIERTRRDIMRLASYTTGVGAARLVPTITVDGGPLPAMAAPGLQ